MQLADYLKQHAEGDAAFAARFMLRFDQTIARVTVRQWRLGQRTPNAVMQERICVLTGEAVKPGDWHKLALRRARRTQKVAA